MNDHQLLKIDDRVTRDPLHGMSNSFWLWIDFTEPFESSPLTRSYFSEGAYNMYKGKGRGVLALLTEHHAMEAYWGRYVYFLKFK
jgi:hypothetical protein